MHAEEETASLVGAGPAPAGEENLPTAVAVPPRPHNNNPNQVSEAAAADDASTEISISATRAALAEAEEKILRAEAALPTSPCEPRGWRRLISLLFPGQQLQMLDEERFRPKMPGYFERLSMDRRLMEDCLHLHNSKNPGNEYEPAPGVVTQYFHFDNGTCWAHGNFVARRKSSGCFSFLPAPRTLFFFELAFGVGFDGVVTCTPLLDEPVTEAYSVLGFPLWWSTRRSGELDAICKTCYRRYELPHRGIQKKFACGHDNVVKLCRMCYLVSCVVHPYPGEFAFGH